MVPAKLKHKRLYRLTLLATAVIFYRRKQRRRLHREYIRSIFRNRSKNGEYFLVKELKDDPEYHFKYFRMTKNTFETLLNAIRPKISHRQSHLCPIPAELRLAVTLRFLATGCSQTQLAMSYRVSISSVNIIIRETMQAIIEYLEPVFLKPPDVNIWMKSETGFANKWNFPFCIGALDGKHVRHRAPRKSGSLNFNYKGYFSTVVLAVVSSDYRFIAVDIGAPGSQSDAGIFSNTELVKSIENQHLQIPNNGVLPNGDEVPYVIVGDEAFPLKPWLMRPFPGHDLDEQRRIFNFRLSRARRVVENAFGIWAARWRILHTPIDGENDLILLIIRATLMLHNFLREKSDHMHTVDNGERDDVQLGTWRGEVANASGVINIPRVGSNNYSVNAFTIRQHFVDYFVSNIGSLPGQSEYVYRS